MNLIVYFEPVNLFVICKLKWIFFQVAPCLVFFFFFFFNCCFFDSKHDSSRVTRLNNSLAPRSDSCHCQRIVLHYLFKFRIYILQITRRKCGATLNYLIIIQMKLYCKSEASSEQNLKCSCIKISGDSKCSDLKF